MSEAAAGTWSGPPLVCSSGRPSIAVVTLLRQLGAGGAVLAQHAHFDAGGLAIANWLTDRAATTPWRMEAADYLAAVAAPRDRVPLASRLPPSPWAPALRDAMRRSAWRSTKRSCAPNLLSAMSAHLGPT